MTALCASFPMRLSSSCRKWMGGGAIKVASLRQVASIAPCRLHVSSQQSEYSTSGAQATVQRSNESQGRRAFANYTFYKGKGAMSMQPGKPVFKQLDGGAAALDREGSMYLEFAPSVGIRQYDWSRKQIIALSVAELGALVGLAMGEKCEFFHDPNMGKNDAGKIRKVLRVEPTSDQAGYFFNFSMSNKMDGSEGRVTVALTRAEYSVLRSAVNYLIPYLMGWHMVADPSRLDDFLPDSDGSSVKSASEWDK